MTLTRDQPFAEGFSAVEHLAADADAGRASPYLAVNDAGWSTIDAIAGALAEEFGVTNAFIDVRLRKYGLIH